MRWALVGLTWTLAPPVFASEPERVVACDTLVSLRLSTAVPDRAGVPSRAAERPGCRTIPRADVGAVEHRAMIGGAPFECLSVRGEARCLWVLP